MPGYRGKDERTKTLAVRVTPREKEEWTTYAGFEGVSALVRRAVREFIEAHPNPKKRPSLFQD